MEQIKRTATAIDNLPTIPFTPPAPPSFACWRWCPSLKQRFSRSLSSVCFDGKQETLFFFSGNVLKKVKSNEPSHYCDWIWKVVFKIQLPLSSTANTSIIISDWRDIERERKLSGWIWRWEWRWVMGWIGTATHFSFVWSFKKTYFTLFTPLFKNFKNKKNQEGINIVTSW